MSLRHDPLVPESVTAATSVAPAHASKVSDRSRSLCGRLADLLLFGLLVLAPSAVGVTHVVSWTVTFVLSVLALALALVGRRTVPRPAPAMAALLSLFGLAAFLPLVPLPSAVLEWLSPQAAWVWGLDVPGGVPDGKWRPVHQAPGEGVYQALRYCTVAAFALACTCRAETDAWRRRALVAVVSGVALAALVCLVQTAAGERAVLGFYDLRADPRRTWLAPLVNENHWAAVLVLGLTVAAGLAWRSAYGALGRAVAMGTALGLLCLVLFGTSRSGVVGLAASLGLLSLMVFLRPILPRRRHSKRASRRTGSEPASARSPDSDSSDGSSRGSGTAARSSSRPSSQSGSRSGSGPTRRQMVARLVAAVLVVGGLTLAAAWGVNQRSLERLDPFTGEDLGMLHGQDRVELLPDALSLAHDHLWTGVGRGAYGDVFPRYRNVPGHELHPFFESLPIDLLVGHGLPLALALVVALLAALLVSLRRALRYPERAGAAAALGGLAVHELADFSTETGAVALAAATLLVVCLASESAGRWSVRRYRAAVFSFLLILPLFLTSASHWDSSREWHVIEGRIAAGELDLDAAGVELSTWHPSSFPLALSMGRWWLAERNPDRSLSWLNRAQLLAPRHPDPHLASATALRALGAESQALIELQLAMKGDWRRLAGRTIRDVAARSDGTDSLRRLLPRDRPGSAAEFALVLAVARDPRARFFVDLAVEEDPADSLTQVVLGLSRLASGEIEEALASLASAIQPPSDLPPDQRLSPGLRFQVAVGLGRAGLGDRELELLRDIARGEDDPGPGVWLRLGTRELAAGNHVSARVALRRVRRYPTNRLVALSYLHEARLDAELNREQSALRLVSWAIEREPELAAAHRLRAGLFDELGRTADALASARNALQIEPASAESRALVKDLSDRVNDREGK